MEKVPTVVSASSNTTSEGSNAVTITVAVNGKTLVSGKSAKVGDTDVDLGTVTGSGVQSIEIKIAQGNMTKTIKKEANIDDWGDNSVWYNKE